MKIKYLKALLFLIIHILIVNFLQARPITVPANAVLSSDGTEYSLIMKNFNPSIRKTWDLEGNLKTESIDSKDKRIFILYEKNGDVDSRIETFRLPNYTEKSLTYNKNGVICVEKISTNLYEDKTFYLNGEWLSRWLQKKGEKEISLPPREKPLGVPEDAVFDYLDKCWDFGKLKGNQREGEWKRIYWNGKYCGLRTYKNGILKGRYVYTDNNGEVIADINK